MTDIDYKSSGVDVQAGEEAVSKIKKMVRKTYTANVLSELGSFGGLYRFDKNSYDEPILVSSTDGVGTKLRVAIMAHKYDTIGSDLVNHCVNDILVQGALPLFFLDYIGVGKLDPQHIEEVIKGIVSACCENSCSLIGGEMAEMPGIYQAGDFDLVGTIVGAVDRKSLLPSDNMKAGDLIVGFPSSGLHTNGYSLARKVIFEKLGLGIESYVGECSATVAELLLQVHVSYLPAIKPLLGWQGLHGLAHITGGGIGGNLKRIVPDGLSAVIQKDSWIVPPLFQWMQDAGKLSTDTMREAFNLGVGMIAIINPALLSAISLNSDVFVMGEMQNVSSDTPKVVFV